MRLCKVRYNDKGIAVGLDFVFKNPLVEIDSDDKRKPEYIQLPTMTELEVDMRVDPSAYIKNTDYTLHEDKPVFRIESITTSKVVRTDGK
jgi:hypothetical protein